VRDEESSDDIELAQALLARWRAGESKSQLEIETWNDPTAHGRHFDRFIRTHLGISTTKPSRQAATIEELSKQIRHLGELPVGVDHEQWERQLLHSRSSGLAALKAWNDPTAAFRTGTFSLLFVAAWNGLCLALLQRAGDEWRKLDSAGHPIEVDGAEQALDTKELVRLALGGEDDSAAALCENVRFWVDLPNCVAHRFLPDLDLPVIPQAQAGLMNFERVLREEFGEEYSFADRLTVPLQLSGFRDPGVLSSRKAMQAALPLDVQMLLNRSDELSPSISSDPAFQMRVAFLPVVPASGRGADAVAYFMKPGEVPDELNESLQQYVVVPKVWRANRWFRASEVAAEVQRRTGFKFAAAPHHSTAAVKLGARPPTDEPPATIDITLAEYVSSFKQYQYTQLWIDRLVDVCADPESFQETTGRPAVPVRIGEDHEGSPDGV